MTLCIECQQSDIQKALSKACEVSTVNTKKTKVMSRQAHATPYTELTITVGGSKARWCGKNLSTSNAHRSFTGQLGTVEPYTDSETRSGREETKP